MLQKVEIPLEEAAKAYVSAEKEVANVDLWQKLIEFNNIHRIKWIKVKGHADNQYNNRCDELATGEIAKNT